MSQNASNQSLFTKNFVLITIINFLVYCGWQMFPSALPPYVKSLGAPDQIIGWLNGIATVATLLIRPFAGVVMDKWGRKGIFNFSLVLLAIAMISFSFFPYIGIILALRFFHGLAWGIGSTGSNTIASDIIPENRISQGMVFFSLSISVSSAVAPALSLALPLQTMLLVAFGFGILAFALHTQVDHPEHVATKSTGKFQPYEKSAVLPAVLIFLVTLSYGAILTFIPLYAGEQGVGKIGLFYTFYAIGMLASRPFLGKLLRRFGLGGAVWPGSLFLAAGLVLLYFADSFPFFMLCGFVYGVGYGILHTSLQTLSVSGAKSHRLGAANATFLTGYDGGMGLGSIIAGILSAKLSYGIMFSLLAICPLLIIGIYLITQWMEAREGNFAVAKR